MELDLYPRGLAKFLLQVAGSYFSTETDAQAAIISGRVQVDGSVVTDTHHLVYPSVSVVNLTCDDNDDDNDQHQHHHLTLPSRPPPFTLPEIYYIDKPQNSVCDLTLDNDPITQACRSISPRIFPCGQLDLNTTGLLLLTSDGYVSRLVCLPGLLPKVYRVGFEAAAGSDGLSAQELALLTTPRDISRPSEMNTTPTIECFTSVTKPREIYTLDSPQRPKKCILKSRFEMDVEISTGQNHVVKRIMRSIGVSVRSLRRIKIGPIELAPNHTKSSSHRTVALSTGDTTDGNNPDSGFQGHTRSNGFCRARSQVPRSDAPPIPVKLSDQQVTELLSALDYTNTLARLRRCELICRWKAKPDQRLADWLAMTSEEINGSCYFGFQRIRCRISHN